LPGNEVALDEAGEAEIVAYLIASTHLKKRHNRMR
jgi:hypothetical protein